MIVLAGGIGSGKSVVARILRLKGFGVFDFDYEARLLMENDSELKEALKEIAGKDIYDHAGHIDRKKLASIIFCGESLRKKVNREVHAAVRAEIERWLGEDNTNIFVETAIASESGIAKNAEMIWMIEASDETRLSRVMHRDEREEKQIRSIMALQKEEERCLEELGVRVVRISNDEDDRLLKEVESLLADLEIHQDI